MCATCVAQGAGYVGTALVGLQVMGARAKARRRRAADADPHAVLDAPPESTDPATADR